MTIKSLFWQRRRSILLIDFYSSTLRRCGASYQQTITIRTSCKALERVFRRGRLRNTSAVSVRRQLLIQQLSRVMGSNPSSLQHPSFNLKPSSPRGRLRRKIARNPVEIPHPSNPRRTPFRRRLHPWRWKKRKREKDRRPSALSIPGLWQHSIGSTQSVKERELRVVNCSRPATPNSIGRCQVYVESPEQDGAKVIGSHVELDNESAGTKGTLSLSENREIASATSKTLENETSQVIASIRDLVIPCERELMDLDRYTIKKHLETAESLTSSFRALLANKSHVD
jgi:hypothetical protein